MKALESRLRITATAFAILLGIGLIPAGGAEVILKNDSIAPGAALTQFLSGERVASWFTVPTAGDLVGVQVVWGSMFGGSPNTIETAITVSAGGVFPTPGATLATVPTPTLVDGPINEYRHLDVAQIIPMQVPVTAGQVVVVDLEFFNTNAGNNFAGSIEHDLDGCQLGLNSVLAIPGVWADACLLGVNGDWGIRAILQPVPEPSAALLVLAGLAGLAARRRNCGTRW